MPEDRDDTTTTPADAPAAVQPAPQDEAAAVPPADNALLAGPEGWTALAAPGKPDGEVDTRA